MDEIIKSVADEVDYSMLEAQTNIMYGDIKQLDNVLNLRYDSLTNNDIKQLATTVSHMGEVLYTISEIIQRKETDNG